MLWNDANGSCFVLSSLPQRAERELVVEDCDVIYSRATWHHWRGGRDYWRYRHHRRHYRGSGLYFGLGVVPGYYYGTRQHYRSGSAHVRWCYDRYRSYRAWDNTYQPYYGPRRQCRSPY